jgi:hypothetical protein
VCNVNLKRSCFGLVSILLRIIIHADASTLRTHVSFIHMLYIKEANQHKLITVLRARPAFSFS